MWSIYSFKLAYAEDNSFELRVNTSWTCSEFVEKVTAVARVTFPSISVTDVMHVTESWNQINDPNYNHIPSEENAPIPLISQTIAERYHPTPRSRCFYIYFQNECQSILARYSRNETRTLEQVEVSMEYYYDIWVGELNINSNGVRELDINNNRNNRETSDRRDTNQWGWTGMNSQYSGDAGLTVNSQAITIDDIVGPSLDNESNMFHLPINLFDDFESEADIDTSNDNINTLDRNNIYNYSNNLNLQPFLTISENIITNPLGFNYTEPEPEFTPHETITNDCCICFTEGIQCFTMEHCNHTVCAPCYTGVYTRVNGNIDLRCPMCRIPNSFNNNVYRQIIGNHL
jgi:hypothetical protein